MNSLAVTKLEANVDKLDGFRVAFTNKLHPYYIVFEVLSK